MRILVLGGTAWIGRETAARAVAAGHEVVCVARGESGEVAPGARLVPADRDRDDALAGVAGERWDAVVDVSVQPGHVRRAVRDLAGAAEHYVQVSSISVYRPTTVSGLDESAPLREPLVADELVDAEDYGGAKVAVEQAVVGAFAGRCTIARAGLIGGPGDSSDRTTYWPHRFARAVAQGGPVLVPDDPEQPASLIDARDLAAWLVRCAEQRVDGVFNAAGRVTTLAEHLAAAARVAGYDGDLVPVSPAWLSEQEVGCWAGPRALPMWLDGEDRLLMGFRSDAAVAAGLTVRPLEETLADGLAWRQADPDHDFFSGLTEAEESALLADVP